MDTRRAPIDELLGVTHVLVNDLPPTIGTDAAPAAYDVAAVFARRPTAVELLMLAEPEVASRLREAGYPDVKLRPADRRLVISGTTLGQLTDGLAALIGEILLEIGERAQVLQRQRDATDADHARDEAHRAAMVLEAAKQVDFRPHRSNYR